MLVGGSQRNCVQLVDAKDDSVSATPLLKVLIGRQKLSEFYSRW